MAQKYDMVKESKKEIFLNNVLGGVAWALGATVGVSLILTIVGIIISKVDTVPLVGNYIENIMQYIADKQETAIESVDKKE